MTRMIEANGGIKWVIAGDIDSILKAMEPRRGRKPLRAMRPMRKRAHGVAEVKPVTQEIVVKDVVNGGDKMCCVAA